MTKRLSIITINNCNAVGNLESLQQFKNMRKNHGRMLLLVKLKASTYNFAKSNTPLWVFVTF